MSMPPPVRKLKMVIAYNGRGYHGWQRQAKGIRTVPERVEQVARKVLRHPLNLMGASRTDTGVHAEGQCAIVVTPNLSIPMLGLRRAMNSRLPEDIEIRSIKQVPMTFHPSLSADATTISTFPRPLGLRHGGPLESLFEIPESFEKRFADYEMLVPASEFGHIEPQGSYPIGAIVLPQYLPDQVTELAVLSPSAAHEAVCQSAPGLIERGRETFVLLADLVRRVPTVKLTTNGLDHAGELLESYLLDSGVVAEGTLR